MKMKEENNHIKEEQHVSELKYGNIKEAVEAPRKETFDNQTITVLKEGNAKNKLNTRLVIIPILLIVVALLGIFMMLKNNSKLLFVDSVQKLEEKLESYVGNGYSNLMNIGNQYTSEENIKVHVTSDLLNDATMTDDMQPYLNLINNINSMEFKGVTKYDRDAKKMVLHLLGNLKEEPLLDITYLVDQNKQYVYLKNILEKYIDLDTEIDIFEMVEESDTNLEDYHYLLDVLEKSLKKNIKDSYIEEETTTILFNQKDTKVKKTTLVLDGKNTNELFGNVLKDLKASSRASSIITAVYPEFKDYEFHMDEQKPGIRYNVYTKGANEIVKIELETDEGSLSFTEEDKDVIEFRMDGAMVFKVEIQKVENGLTIEVTDANQMVVTIHGTNQNGNINGEIMATVGTVKIQGNLTSSITKKSDSEYQTVVQVSVHMNSEGMNVFAFTVDGTSNIKKGATITETVQDSVRIDDLTEEEMNQLMEAFYTILGVQLMQ